MLAERVNQEGKDFGMQTKKQDIEHGSRKKQQCTQSKNPTNEQEVEQGSQCVYLGELITEHEKSEEEIRRRIEIARRESHSAKCERNDES